MSVRTNLIPIEDGVNLLSVQGVTLLDIDEVDSWLYAMDLLSSERKKACRQLLAEGSFSMCNIEHRVEMVCKT